MSKKVLFNLEISQPERGGVKRHGGGRYAEIVFKRIVERGLPVSVIYDSSKWFNPDVKALCDRPGVKAIDIAGKTLREIVDAEKPDLLYQALSRADFDNLKGVKRCVTLHGLRWLETPLDSYFWKYRQPNIEKIKFLLRKYAPKFMNRHESWRFTNFADDPDISFIAVSEHTRNSFRAFFPQFDKLEIPVFFSPSTSSDTPATTRRRDDKYFLMVSGTRWEKNNLRAIQAFDRLFSHGQLAGFKAIVTGVASADNLKYKIKNPDRFELVGYVEDDELEQLYHDAYCFVYPTLNEGFGYPPLEAMRYGIPVVASPVTSVSEVLGDAAMYFNPFSIEEIMGRLLAVAETDKHEGMSEASLARYAKITAKQKSDLDKFIDYLYE